MIAAAFVFGLVYQSFGFGLWGIMWRLCPKYSGLYSCKSLTFYVSPLLLAPFKSRREWNLSAVALAGFVTWEPGCTGAHVPLKGVHKIYSASFSTWGFPGRFPLRDWTCGCLRTSAMLTAGLCGFSISLLAALGFIIFSYNSMVWK